MCDVSRAQWSKDVLRLRVPFYVIVTAIIIKFAAILFKFAAIITLYLQQLNLYICCKFSFNSHQFNIFLSVGLAFSHFLLFSAHFLHFSILSNHILFFLSILSGELLHPIHQWEFWVAHLFLYNSGKATAVFELFFDFFAVISK